MTRELEPSVSLPDLCGEALESALCPQQPVTESSVPVS